MMRQVLIVDDNTIVRIILHSPVDQEALRYQVVADTIHDEQVLVRLRKYPVDLVVTGIKMPVMDGIGLLTQMSRMVSNRELPAMPKVLVFSGYNDFNLVRESLRLGASGYLLKADLNEAMSETVLKRLNDEWQDNEDRQNSEARQNSTDGGVRQDGAGGDGQQERTYVPEMEGGQLPVDMAMGERDIRPEFFSGGYIVIQFEVEDFVRHSSRFDGDMRKSLAKPVLEFVGQIPRVVSKCMLRSTPPSRYVMLYQAGDRDTYQDTVLPTCYQLCSVQNNYVNLPVSCRVSSVGNGAEEFAHWFTEAGNRPTLHCLKGKAQACSPWEKGCIRYEDAAKTEEEYRRLLKGLPMGGELVVNEEKTRLSAACYQEGPEKTRLRCLRLICRLAQRLLESHDGIDALFANEVDYYKKLGRLNDVRNLEVQMNNYLHWVTDYMQHHYDRKQADMMIRTERSIMDNYASPGLTPGSVAGYIGLNEKYFSSRSTKEEGMTFFNYLTEVRIRKVRELMEQTDLEIYGISRSVGYNSVEHFTGVSRKLCRVSPGGYRKWCQI